MNTNSEFDKVRQKENQKIRQEALKIRNRILDRSQKEKALVKNLMPFFAHASRPGFFIPFRDEPDLSGLLKMVPDYLVPKVISKTEMIFWKPENLKKNKPETDKRNRSKKRTEEEEEGEEDDYFDPTRNPFDPNDRGRRRNTGSY